MVWYTNVMSRRQRESRLENVHFVVSLSMLVRIEIVLDPRRPDPGDSVVLNGLLESRSCVLWLPGMRKVSGLGDGQHDPVRRQELAGIYEVSYSSEHVTIQPRLLFCYLYGIVLCTYECEQKQAGEITITRPAIRLVEDLTWLQSFMRTCSNNLIPAPTLCKDKGTSSAQSSIHLRSSKWLLQTRPE